MFIWTLLSVCCLAAAQRSFSYSVEYGGSGGNRFSQSGNQLDGPITALRIRNNRSYITGLQLRYGTTWSRYEGGPIGDLKEVSLEDGEHIKAVSGRFTTTLQRLIFYTTNGREFDFGNDRGLAFDSTPLYNDTVLTFVSGRSSFLINAIGFHWGNQSTI